ncbi:hypothetical protein FDP41_004408 [Naegleria fowleri]|uniref:Uncharacterized protein n=2 Tax=Naegleria fowleri TaxID=5763 RepID=A0A6A5BUD4_NAEFO|nr:uncharacterized protein FDP41_004408 [Naegleria fowleri]KAF0976509.1 hypothetical protein FDP41_004408 [Naegleria fowleri]
MQFHNGPSAVKHRNKRQHQQSSFTVHPTSTFQTPQTPSSQELKFNCNGFPSDKYSELLFGDCIFNANYKPIAIKTGTKLKSVECNQLGTKATGICNNCQSTMNHLDQIISKKDVIFQQIADGVRPAPKSLLAYPLLMYEIISKLVVHSKELTETESELVSLFRQAQEHYDSTWNFESVNVEYVMESPQKKVKLDLRTEPTCKPCLPEMKKPFEDTFFMQFIFDQLRNYNRDPRHHQYSDIAKRFWILVKYYAGKQFFVRMAGARNQHQPCN